MDDVGVGVPGAGLIRTVDRSRAAKRPSVLLAPTKADQTTVELSFDHLCSALQSRGLYDDVERITKQLKGGACRVCSAKYQRVEVKNLFADFVMFQPVCHCEEDDDQRRARIDAVCQGLLVAGVPEEFVNSTFETWDHGAEAKTNESMRAVYQYAKERDYRRQGLVLYGDVGTGKTRCAIGVLRRAADDGLRVRFVKMAEIVGRFADRERGRAYVDGLLRSDMVLFDDLDKIGSLGNEWVAEQVFRVFDGLIGEGHRIVATSNLPDYPAFVEKFGAPVVSRLMGACLFVQFEGADYRIRRAQMERLNRDAVDQQKGGGRRAGKGD